MSSLEQRKTEEMRSLVDEFTGPNKDYYWHQFVEIGKAVRFHLSFNFIAALLGPIWFAARGLWHWFIPFLLLEAFAATQIALGLFSDLGAEQRARAEKITQTLETRREQLAQAVAENADNVDGLKRVVTALENAVSGAMNDAAAQEALRLQLLLFGLLVMLILKVGQGVVGNWALERQFTRWRSDKNIASGLSAPRALAALLVVMLVYGLSATQFAYPTSYPALMTFPTDGEIRITVSDGLRDGFDRLTVAGQGVFENITFAIRTLLDGLETIFVGTPWFVVILFIALLAWQTSGPRVAIFAVAGLCYLGILGFWDKAMATVSLLGAAACISISLGIPLGIACARKPRLFAVVRPMLDFMQTMPSFVYLIPVIAFFGTGKPAAIMATLVFGSPPVIRLTVLGLQGVPDHVREAAIAFGATPAYLLFRVDLPLAAKTIMAGVNQTIMLSLAMVVIASLIGAKGLGEDVLEALQYASTGEGILAGLAILICSMTLDRIIQGRAR